MIRVQLLAGFILALYLVCASAIAHEVRPSIVTLKFAADRSYSLEVSTNIEALLAKIGPEHEDTDDAPTAQLYNELRNLPPAQLSKRFLVFGPEWSTSLGLTFNGEAAGVTIANVLIPEIGDTDLARDSTIQLNGTVPAKASVFSWAYPEGHGSSVLRIERPGQELEAQFFAAGTRRDDIPIGISAPRSSSAKFWNYMVVGFTHILPKGLDHILFVLGLFLLSAQWRPLLAQVTAFTLAHSVTLALGLYGLVSISPAIVEPLIALSIVYVAVENIFTRRLHAWRPVIVFLFGLLHGLGFAGILTEIGLPRADFLLGLIAFNVGVELGQLTIIALAFLAVVWFISRPWYRARITIPASLAIAALSAWWFVERTML